MAERTKKGSTGFDSLDSDHDESDDKQETNEKTKVQTSKSDASCQTEDIGNSGSESASPASSWRWPSRGQLLGGVAIASAGILGAGILIPVAATAVGFGSGGIIGGSIAAGIQAGIGNVAAGSVFAGIQSAAASGALATAGAGLQGAGVVGLTAAAGAKVLGKKGQDSENQGAAAADPAIKGDSDPGTSDNKEEEKPTEDDVAVVQMEDKCTQTSEKDVGKDEERDTDQSDKLKTKL